MASSPLTLGRIGVLLLASGMLTAITVGPVSAQSFPTRPLTLVLPSAAGVDRACWARVLAEKMSPRLGQPVVVENKPGVGGFAGRCPSREGGTGRPHPSGHHQRHGDRASCVAEGRPRGQLRSRSRPDADKPARTHQHCAHCQQGARRRSGTGARCSSAPGGRFRAAAHRSVPVFISRASCSGRPPARR